MYLARNNPGPVSTGTNDGERDRVDFLRRPLPHNLNNPRLFEITPCRVLRPFFVGGVRVEVDAKIELPFHVARDLKDVNKVEIL